MERNTSDDPVLYYTVACKKEQKIKLKESKWESQQVGGKALGYLSFFKGQKRLGHAQIGLV